MTIPHVLLGLLEDGPRHGYTLKNEYDARFGQGRPLRYGQVYATLARLQRDGWAEELAIESGAGPDRRNYAVTPAGVAELEQWLAEPEAPTSYTTSTVFAKTLLATASGRSAEAVLDAQRRVHVARMRELLQGRAGLDTAARLAAEYEIAHLDADLRWIETVLDALPELGREHDPEGRS